MSLSLASVSRPVARPSLLAFLVPSLLRSIPSTLAPPPAPTTAGESVSIWQSLQDLLPSIVLAVPKKQTSKRAKRMRSLNKHLRPKLSACPPPPPPFLRLRFVSLPSGQARPVMIKTDIYPVLCNSSWLALPLSFGFGSPLPPAPPSDLTLAFALPRRYPFPSSLAAKPPDINHCPACGLPKLHAHICNECLSSIQRDLKNEARIKESIAKDFAKKNGLEEPEFQRTPNYLKTGNPGPFRTAVAEVAKTEVEGKEERP